VFQHRALLLLTSRLIHLVIKIGIQATRSLA
jgi:hypothetical protein